MTAPRTIPKFLAAAIAGAVILAASPALSACFEVIGCTDSQYFSVAKLKRLSCDPLWTVRNTIFDENGYCFQTAKGKSVFSNVGCLYTVSGNVPLNAYERANVERVKQVEAQKGCN